ncbi:MAG: lipoate--protein ligase family protein [Candidatus Krumholzibacteria bacterium]|nr:lipoate--protein ligase family protein [Candidatus Krumholzibacteria bacterium]
MPMQRWLLLDDSASDGPLNMAVDGLLLERAGADGALPVLRLYSFDPPAITIGWHQDPARALDLGAVRADGLDVARRVTGGRALLHDGEVTYCVAAPLSGHFAGSLQETFRALAGAVSSALRSLGVDARVSAGRRVPGPGGAAPPCLASAGRHEITARGRKIAGSAQRRTRRSFVQHGSILLEPGSERIARYLRSGPLDLSSSVTSVAGETGGPADRIAVRRALVGAFGELFGSPPAAFRLGEEEMRTARSRAGGLRIAGPAAQGEEV